MSKIAKFGGEMLQKKAYHFHRKCIYQINQNNELRQFDFDF